LEVGRDANNSSPWKRNNVTEYLTKFGTWNNSLVQNKQWKMDLECELQKVGWGDVDWIEVAQGRDWWQALVTAIMNLRVP